MRHSKSPTSGKTEIAKEKGAVENNRTLTDTDIRAIKNTVICDELRLFRKLLAVSPIEKETRERIDRYAAKEIETRGGNLRVF